MNRKFQYQFFPILPESLYKCEKLWYNVFYTQERSFIKMATTDYEKKVTSSMEEVNTPAERNNNVTTPPEGSPSVTGCPFGYSKRMCPTANCEVCRHDYNHGRPAFHSTK
jgi:hypothetical protein